LKAFPYSALRQLQFNDLVYNVSADRRAVFAAREGKFMKRGLALPTDVSREGMPNDPSSDADARNFEVVNDTLQPSPPLNLRPAAMDAAGRPFIFRSYMAVYAPDTLHR
jgi:hypothetical protein